MKLIVPIFNDNPAKRRVGLICSIDRHIEERTGCCEFSFCFIELRLIVAFNDRKWFEMVSLNQSTKLISLFPNIKYSETKQTYTLQKGVVCRNAVGTY